MFNPEKSIKKVNIFREYSETRSHFTVPYYEKPGFLFQASPEKNLRGGRIHRKNTNQITDCANCEIKHFIMSSYISITKYIRMSKINI
jgi:hypothetical protein